MVEPTEAHGFGSELLSAEQWVALATSRSRVYGFLGTVYNRLPDGQFAENLTSLDQDGFLSSLVGTEDLPEDVREGLELIEGFVRACSNTVHFRIVIRSVTSKRRIGDVWRGRRG